MKPKSIIQIVLLTFLLIPFTAFSLEWVPMSSGTTNDLMGIWGSSGTDVFAVGEAGTVLHYDGTVWSSMSSGTTCALNGIWGSSGTDVFAVGSGGAILHYDGTNWSPMTSSATVNLNGIWGNSATDVFAVGDNGVILHYDGAGWSAMNSGTGNDLYGVWGSSGTDVFAVGEYSTILHFNGTDWSAMAASGAYDVLDLYGIWGSSGTDVFAVGTVCTSWHAGNCEMTAFAILHYNGTIWSSNLSYYIIDAQIAPKQYLKGIWGSSGTDVYAVGWYWNMENFPISFIYEGAIIHYSCTSWSALKLGGSIKNGIWGSSKTDIFAVGTGGTILHYVEEPSNFAYSILGTVSGDVQADVTMTLSGGCISDTTTTDSAGNYSFNSLSNGRYTITPSKEGYVFSPASRQVDVLGTGEPGVDFTATITYAISGTVSQGLGKIPFPEVTMGLTGSDGYNSIFLTQITDNNGRYTFSNLPNGTYWTLSADKDGYRFMPRYKNITINGADVPNQDFRGRPSLIP